MIRHTGVATAFLAVLLGMGCGSTSPVYASDPTAYLLTIDEMATPDFTVLEAAHHVAADTLAKGDATLLAALKNDGLSDAAQVRYYRVTDVTLANGPVDVVATVERFPSATDASSVYLADINARDRNPAAQSSSTGPLGDEAHADSLLAIIPNTGGVQAVQITVEWRVGNLVNTIVVRGRDGGARPDDALLLAHAQSNNELNGLPSLTPRPTPKPSATPSGTASPRGAGSPPAGSPRPSASPTPTPSPSP